MCKESGLERMWFTARDVITLRQTMSFLADIAPLPAAISGFSHGFLNKNHANDTRMESQDSQLSNFSCVKVLVEVRPVKPVRIDLVSTPKSPQSTSHHFS